jgi:hypothetical protein
LKAGAPLKHNNQNHVFSCEGPQGQTTLAPDFVPGPISRDFAALKAEEQKKKEEAAKAAAAAKPAPK